EGPDGAVVRAVPPPAGDRATTAAVGRLLPLLRGVGCVAVRPDRDGAHGIRACGGDFVAARPGAIGFRDRGRDREAAHSAAAGPASGERAAGQDDGGGACVRQDARRVGYGICVTSGAAAPGAAEEPTDAWSGRRTD